MKSVKPVSVFLLSTAILLNGVPITEQANAKTSVSQSETLTNVNVTNASLKKAKSYQNQQLGTVTLTNTAAVPKNMFKGSTIQKLVIKSNVSLISESAFENAVIHDIVMNKTAGITHIGKRAFFHANIFPMKPEGRFLLDKTKIIDDSAFQEASVASLQIQNHTTKIGANAFHHFITSLLIDESTNKRTVGKSAFHHMYAKRLDVHTSEASNLKDNLYMHIESDQVTIETKDKARNETILPVGLFQNAKIGNVYIGAKTIKSIKRNAFTGATVGRLFLDASVVGSIEPGAFDKTDMENFETKGQTVIQRIHDKAFNDTTLKSVSIQMVNGFISGNAFVGKHLERVAIRGSVQEVQNGAFHVTGDTPILYVLFDTDVLRHYGNEHLEKGTLATYNTSPVVNKAIRITLKNYISVSQHAFSMQDIAKLERVSIELDNSNYGYPAKEIGKKAFVMPNSQNVKVDIRGDVNNIGASAFEGFTGNLNVYNDLYSVGTSAFKHTRISNIHKIVESVRNGIGKEAFSGAGIGPIVKINAYQINGSAFYNNGIEQVQFTNTKPLIIGDKAFQKNKIKKITKKANTKHKVAANAFDKGITF